MPTCALMRQCVHVQAIINGHLSKSRKTAFKKGDRWCDFKETSPGCGPHQERRRTGTWFQHILTHFGLKNTINWSTWQSSACGKEHLIERKRRRLEEHTFWRRVSMVLHLLQLTSPFLHTTCPQTFSPFGRICSASKANSILAKLALFNQNQVPEHSIYLHLHENCTKHSCPNTFIGKDIA